MAENSLTRLERQIAFLVEVDQLKTIERQSVLMDNSRAENTAEHSWHVCLWALVLAPPEIDVDHVIKMLIVHDVVEVDAGDHPIHLETQQQLQAERAAADRLFGLLPMDQAQMMHALWQEFEEALTPAAQFAKLMDHCQPIFQVLDSSAPLPDHLDVVAYNLSEGRAADLATRWPAGYRAVQARLDGAVSEDEDLERALRFLAEADQLKTVTRATMLCDNSRRENSAEHSWHLTLYALVLADQAHKDVVIETVIRMLILHDLVEIDAGDNPIFGSHSVADMDVQEQAAATRIFGLLPDALSNNIKDLWVEFEAASTPEAQFGKSLDRFQPPMQNLMSGGGSWVEYEVTQQQIFDRVGAKIQLGAPALWEYAQARIADFFAAHIDAR